MTFTHEEKEFLKLLIKNELKIVEEQGKSVLITEAKPGFLAMEEKYEDFLERLLKKL